MPSIMHNAFHTIHKQLKNPSHFETQLSGSTCCTVVFDRNVLFCANAGDSRAVLYSFDKVKNGLSVQSMSVDHKPEMTYERKRIENKNGRVDSIRGMQG